jgi:HK97 family phage prohead protease
LGLKTKCFNVQVKSADLEEGVISGYASVFGNVDSYGDIVAKGAFSKSIEKIEKAGKVISVFYGHNMEDPRANIGRVIELREDSHGLFFKAQLDLSGGTYGRLVYEQLKDGRLDSLSFGFSVIDGANAEAGYELRELELYEISVVPIPANQEALITEVKAGRAISAKNMDLIRRAHEALGELLSAYEDDPEITNNGGQKGVPMAEIMALLGIEEEK